MRCSCALFVIVLSISDSRASVARTLTSRWPGTAPSPFTPEMLHHRRVAADRVKYKQSPNVIDNVRSTFQVK
ncbi:MAG: hypothetical protein ACODAD_05080 [Planctomycetota bacterium]